MAAAIVRRKPTPKNGRQAAHDRAMKKEMMRDKVSPSDLKPVIDEEGFVFSDSELDLLPPLPLPPYPPLCMEDGTDEEDWDIQEEDCFLPPDMPYPPSDTANFAL